MEPSIESARPASRKLPVRHSYGYGVGVQKEMRKRCELCRCFSLLCVWYVCRAGCTYVRASRHSSWAINVITISARAHGYSITELFFPLAVVGALSPSGECSFYGSSRVHSMRHCSIGVNRDPHHEGASTRVHRIGEEGRKKKMNTESPFCGRINTSSSVSTDSADHSTGSPRLHSLVPNIPSRCRVHGYKKNVPDLRNALCDKSCSSLAVRANLATIFS